MPTSREMRLYLLPCTSSRSERTIVGTVAFEGRQPQYQCTKVHGCTKHQIPDRSMHADYQKKLYFGVEVVKSGQK